MQKTSAGLGLGISAGEGLGSLFNEKYENIRKSERLRLPREVWTASVTLYNLSSRSMEEKIKRVLKRMEEVVPYQPDIICLTEIFPAAMVPELPPISERAEIVPGPIVTRFMEFANKHNCYVICPLHTKKGDYVYNTAVLIARDGSLAGEYYKIHPTENEMKKGVTPGPVTPPVFETDFGKIGILICFDSNWPDKWRALKDSGVEIVFWPSAYEGGKLLNSLALNNHYYVVTCPWITPAKIIDITGEELFSSGRLQSWVCAPVNLDKELFHWDFHGKKVRSIQDKYGEKVDVKIYHPDGWFVLESRSPDVTVADVAEEFELVTYDSYIKRAAENQNKKRP
ncbi:carbon-nitrogen hydrolase family protein [candidate division KSB1 bacterium]